VKAAGARSSLGTARAAPSLRGASGWMPMTLARSPSSRGRRPSS
jgi:hypothetical protein